MQRRNSYRVSLGLFELVSLGLGGTIGSGIFVVPGNAAGIAGPSSILAWIFASVSATCVWSFLLNIFKCVWIKVLHFACTIVFNLISFRDCHDSSRDRTIYFRLWFY